MPVTTARKVQQWLISLAFVGLTIFVVLHLDIPNVMLNSTKIYRSSALPDVAPATANASIQQWGTMRLLWSKALGDSEPLALLCKRTL